PFDSTRGHAKIPLNNKKHVVQPIRTSHEEPADSESCVDKVFRRLSKHHNQFGAECRWAAFFRNVAFMHLAGKQLGSP
ncbi:hypothetical protein KC219_26390, partial [Mycobacterium tuberculosis]|nr:hypothetical protein [Mycobacterium tuberculosis]